MTRSPTPLATLPLGSLEAYTQAVNQIPMLSAAEEKRLARRFRQHNDLDAARRLVLSHLRFVVRIARGYDGYGLQQADLIQEGNIGLMKAVKRFDPEMNVRLVSFAVHWVRAEMHEFILRNWRIVKVATTKAQRKLFFNLRSAKKRLGWFTHEEVQKVAQDLGVSPETVLEMEARMSGVDTPLEGSADPGDDNPKMAPIAYLAADTQPDPAQSAEENEWQNRHRECLSRALQDLDPRSRDIVQKRWLAEPKATLHELAEHYGVSAERIRQIEQAAIKKMKVVMEA
ncbi:MAG TPA: RNA polymerase sigma factor RpoH [Gammaproteobacteria bacterium]|nr:RNA polymerase sigma factor RpoH [Gammaproteobacteria bacterium]